MKNPETQSLSRLLRTHTVQVHLDTERRSFVRDLLHGHVPPDRYARYLASLLPGYQQMEAALHIDPHPALLAFADPRLYRVNPLREDLQYYAPNSNPEPVDAGHRWADRVRELHHQPALLLAHLYTRYLGDLSGGQVIGARLRQHYHLPESHGDHFYRFPDIDDVREYKNHLRRAIDAAGETLNNTQRDAVLDESVRAFQMSAAIFDALT